jgi:plastocyanin
MGSWEFSGNALAVHTKNPTEFTVSYSVSATATAGEPAPEPETPTMGMPVLPQIRDVSIPEGSSTPGCEQTNECFMPNSLQVNVGDTVTWTNEDTAAHTVTSGTPVDGPSGLFDSGLIVAGSTFDFTFNETGTYPYFCIVHPWMKGEIKVSEFKETEVFGEEISEPPMEEPVVEEKRASMPEISISQGSGAPGCEKTNECFIPYQLEVFSGESVIWKNPDSAAHTVTSGVPGSPNGMFDSGMLMPNQTFEFHFVESGEYDYYCMVHPWMTGKVIVN